MHRMTNKYCYIQECLNILDKGVVRSVGGLVVNAEYSYSETKNADIGGIITQYKLLNCGTINKTFENKEKCNFYYSELNDLQEGWTK